MTESLATSNDAAAERAAEQARLRKERREAKIKAGGSARLNKITGMGGRVVGESTFTPPAPEPTASATPTATPSKTAPSSSSSPAAARQASSSVPAADPDEVDISQHFYTPASAARGNPSPIPDPSSISEAQLRQMMLGFDRPSSAQQPGGGGDEDPIMKMMSQMLGGGLPGGQPGAGFPAGFPGASPMAAQQQQQQPRPDPQTALWRVLHALVALGLGLYISILTPFDGSRVQREREALSADPLSTEFEHHKRVFFWIFATAEAVLLTTRLFVAKPGSSAPSGMISMVVDFLPEPIKGSLMLAMRYWQILATVRTDLMACMFVLGACAWFRS